MGYADYWLYLHGCVCYWLCCMRNCEPDFLLVCWRLRFDLVWSNCECGIRPEVTLYGWRDVKIEEPTRRLELSLSVVNNWNGYSDRCVFFYNCFPLVVLLIVWCVQLWSSGCLGCVMCTAAIQRLPWLCCVCSSDPAVALVVLCVQLWYSGCLGCVMCTAVIQRLPWLCCVYSCDPTVAIAVLLMIVVWWQWVPDRRVKMTEITITFRLSSI